MDTVTLNTSTGLMFVVPASLHCLTTYVLLEQERWYGREADYLAKCLRPGMICVDVNAGLGVDALPMARAVGSEGRVIAYQPASEAAALIEESGAKNKLHHLMVRDIALSDKPREAKLFLGAGIEGATLNPTPEALNGAVEAVTVSTLDAEAARLFLDRLDVLKLGPDGEALRILDGAKESLETFAPLIVFSTRNGPAIDLKTAETLQGRGYGIYRLLGEPVMLAPWSADAHEPTDLNLFAVSPDQAQLLERLGLLAREARQIDLGMTAPRLASELMLQQPFLPAFGAVPPFVEGDPYVTALAAYAAWLDPARPAPERYGALRLSVYTLQGLCALDPTPGRLATLARVAFAAGERRAALLALEGQAAFNRPPKDEAFLAASPRFDRMPPGEDPAGWFLTQILEQDELLGILSTRYRASHAGNLGYMCSNGAVAPEVLRRLVLQHVVGGSPHTEALQALIDARPQLNAEALKIECLRAMI